MSSSQRTGQEAAVSLATEDRGQPQRVVVAVRGVEYPGEVVVADVWDATFGAPLTADAMFRVVLLDSAEAPQVTDLHDSRTGVLCWPAALGNAEGEEVGTGPLDKLGASGTGLTAQSTGEDDRGAGGRPYLDRRNVASRVAESRAAYTAGNGPIQSELAALRETKKRFLAGPDPGLKHLAHAISRREAEAQDELARHAAKRWNGGRFVLSETARYSGPWQAEIPVIVDGPAAWVEAAAAVLLARAGHRPQAVDGPPLTRRRLAELWGMAGDGRAAEAVRALDNRFPALNASPGGPTVLGEIDDLLDSPARKVTGDVLRRRLVHDLGLPPAVAGVCVAAHVAERDSELVLIPAPSQPGPEDTPRLFRDMLPGLPHQDDLLSRAGELRDKVTGDWDSALPYVRLVLPEARPLALGGGGSHDGLAFARAAETLEGRFALAFSVLERLERRLGQSGRAVNVSSEKLFILLTATSWQEYFRHARTEFGSVAKLKGALDTAQRLRRAGDDAVEIERCAAYLDGADFGRPDQPLAIEAEALRARLDLLSILENPSLWPPLEHDFRNWRRRYQRTYWEFHAARQAAAREMLARIEEGSRQLRAVERFAMVPELGRGPDPSLSGRWREVSSAVRECPASPDEASLADAPQCPECGARMGAPLGTVDVEKTLTEIRGQLAQYNTRLGDATVREVLAGQRRDEVEKLLQISAAGDLSTLSTVLSDDVISFLRQFLRGAGSPERSRVDQ